MTAHALNEPGRNKKRTTVTMSKQRTITLTGRRPVVIDEAEWPVIAMASGDDYSGHDPALHQQASDQGQLDEFSLRVRQHAGQAIVYGTYTEGWHSSHDGLTRAGELLLDADDIAAAITRVGGTLGVPAQLIADCIAELPAEKL